MFRLLGFFALLCLVVWLVGIVSLLFIFCLVCLCPYLWFGLLFVTRLVCLSCCTVFVELLV